MANRAGRLDETPPRGSEVFANGINVYLAGQQLWIIDGMSGSIACAADATGRVLAADRDMSSLVSDLAPVAPGRLAIPINGDVLIVAPKPVCEP